MAISIDEWQRAGRAYRHRGHPIFYRDEGAGPPLVLVHGYDYRLADQADLVEGLLASLDVRRVGVLAHDYGDTVAQELLARARERAPGGLELAYVCLLNGGLYPEMHRPRLIQRLLASPLGPLVARLLNERSFARSFSAVFGPATKPPPDELASFWRLVERDGGTRVYPRLIGYMAERRRHRERWVGALERPPCPVRLIDGPEDPISGAHLAAHYRARVPHADVVLLPGIGHYPQTEAPDEVRRAFLEFVDRVEASAASALRPERRWARRPRRPERRWARCPRRPERRWARRPRHPERRWARRPRHPERRPR
ncbi:MAG: alpha/beta hydrolase [Polyangiaceae bacterium]|nr:alpha/beta hydrolase [Polyangiaceae bacterium]